MQKEYHLQQKNTTYNLIKSPGPQWAQAFPPAPGRDKKEGEMRTKQKSEAAQAAALIRKILKKEYPDVKFKIRSKYFAGGSDITIKWEDGIKEDEIKSFVKQFKYGHFDGMTDCYYCDNVKEMPQAKYVFTERRMSKGTEEKIFSDLSGLIGIPASPDATVSEDFRAAFRRSYYPNVLYRLAYQLFEDYDFRKGFHGVRRKRTEDGREIENVFELY